MMKVYTYIQQHINLRIALEFTLLISIALIAVLQGARHPIEAQGGPVGTDAQISIIAIFFHNFFTLLGVLAGSLFSGGLVGIIMIFLNVLLYGRYLHIYNHYSAWTALFPWLEMAALLLAAQAGTDVFWCLVLRKKIHIRFTVSALAISILLLMFAAIIEGGILHV